MNKFNQNELNIFKQFILNYKPNLNIDKITKFESVGATSIWNKLNDDEILKLSNIIKYNISKAKSENTLNYLISDNEVYKFDNEQYETKRDDKNDENKNNKDDKDDNNKNDKNDKDKNDKDKNDKDKENKNNSDLDIKIIFDPLLQFNNNVNNYINYLTVNSLFYPYFIISEKEVNDFITTTNPNMFPYVFHIYLMKYYISKCKFKIQDKLDDKGLILFPYIYKFNEIKKYKNICTEIPFTQNQEFNNFIFKLWNFISNSVNYEYCEIDNEDEDNENEIK